ncbi:hypothetical protein CAOG_08295 [Capsaspora owczarzaki ATCC 30864]|nr:hypothetical protein CAOG_08295 [Capsaspora owczarzaki ATCC 30864]KJE98319.1 hypothetical protein CAOG_008295 [Capsaspora owczarzaki ATCC 30864]|eukprot:XP_004341960.1 hypothetical protein CAOG_08295 [Capsaspora owczarzaki ATCC 30864]
MLQLVGGRDLVSLSDGEVRALLQSVLAALTPEATLPCLNWTWAQQLLDGTESAVETLAGLVSSVAALVHRVRDNDAAQADLAAAGSRRGGSNSPLATILLTGNAQAIADKPLSYHSPLFYHGTRGYYADLQVGCIMLEQVFGTASLLVTHCSSLGTSLVSGRVPSELGKSVMGRGLQWFPHSLLLRRAWHALRREQGRYQRLLSGLGELAMESGPLGLAFAIEDERTAGSRVHQAGGFDEETESMQGRINRIRAVLARAFDPTSRQCEGQFQSEVRHCVPLWRMFLQFEASCVFREEAAARVRERDLLVTLETKTSGLLERQEGQQLLQAERLRFLQPTSAAAPPQQHQTTGDGAENAELERLKSGFHKRLEDERRRRHRRQRQRLTGVFVRALQQCPWAKVLYLDAIQCGLYRGPLHPDLATQLQMVRNPHDWDDSLQDVVDLMQEKGLHVRTSVEEIEALDHVDAHRANDGSAMTF